MNTNKAFVVELIGGKKRLTDYPERMSDSIVVYEPASLPTSGVYRGKRAFAEFYRKMRKFYDLNQFQLEGVYGDADKVFAVSKAVIADTEDAILLCEEIRFDGRKIVEARLYFHDERPVQESIRDADAMHSYIYFMERIACIATT